MQYSDLLQILMEDNIMGHLKHTFDFIWLSILETIDTAKLVNSAWCIGSSLTGLDNQYNVGIIHLHLL